MRLGELVTIASAIVSISSLRFSLLCLSLTCPFFFLLVDLPPKDGLGSLGYSAACYVSLTL